MIDPKLQAELRAKFNPDGSDLRKMQLRMLDMLKYIDKICRENNIKYWLSSGTCLGAVRHGGFIPWDDDVDIELEKTDYKRLIKILQQRKGNYILQNETTDPNYMHPFAKLRDLKSEVKENNNTDKWTIYRGCFIDIFCIEPSYSKFIWRICSSLWFRMVFKSNNIKMTSLRKFVLNMSRLILCNLVFPLVRIGNIFTSKKCYRHILGVGFLKERCPKDICEVEFIPFEDTMLPVPINYDHYLAKIYGDYLSIPQNIKFHNHFTKCNIL